MHSFKMILVAGAKVWSFSQAIYKQIGGLVAKSGQTLATPWTVACQAPLSMGFSSKNIGVSSPFLFTWKIRNIQDI